MQFQEKSALLIEHGYVQRDGKFVRRIAGESSIRELVVDIERDTVTEFDRFGREVYTDSMLWPR